MSPLTDWERWMFFVFSFPANPLIYTTMREESRCDDHANNHFMSLFFCPMYLCWPMCSSRRVNTTTGLRYSSKPSATSSVWTWNWTRKLTSSTIWSSAQRMRGGSFSIIQALLYSTLKYGRIDMKEPSATELSITSFHKLPRFSSLSIWVWLINKYVDAKSIDRHACALETRWRRTSSHDDEMGSQLAQTLIYSG